jgi:hypothetical protein
MPNNKKECPGKKRVDALANKALADLKKVSDQHPELDLGLVETSLKAIPLDVHH